MVKRQPTNPAIGLILRNFWILNTKRTAGYLVIVGRKEYESHFHWRHPKEKICITVAYHKESKKFLGINTFGIRMRHEIFDRWLTEERSVDHVMEYLKDANFDPEFYTQYEAEIVSEL